MTHKIVISTYRAKTPWTSVGAYPDCIFKPRSVKVSLLSCHSHRGCQGLAAQPLCKDHLVKRNIMGSCPYFSFLDTFLQRRIKDCVWQLWYHFRELYFSMSLYKTSPMTSELWNIADFKCRKFLHRNNCFLAIGIWRTDPWKGWHKSYAGDSALGNAAQKTSHTGAEA